MYVFRFHTQALILLAALLLAAYSHAQTAESYYESALAYQAEGETQSAIIELKNALQQSEDHLPARLMLGRLQLEVGEPADAESQLQAALDLGGDRNLIMPDLGMAWLQQGKTEQVLNYQRQSRLLPRERALWYDIRGKAQLALDNYAEAYKEFSTSLRLNPNQVDAITGQAYARLFQKRTDIAAELAAQALDLAPGNDGVLKLLGDIATADEDFALAMDFYNQAVEANSGNYNARLRRVVLNLSQGEFEAAEADIDAVLADYPSNPRALIAKAMLLTRQSRNREAQRLLEEFNFRLSNITSAQMAANVNIQIIRALTLYLQGSYGQALPILEDINQDYPEKTFIRQMLTDTYFARRRYDEIVNLYQPISALNSSDARYVYVYARAAWRARKFRDAELKLQEWSQQNPQIFGELTNLLAASYATEGRLEEALATIDEVEGEAQARLGSRLLLGNIQLQEQQLDDAKQTAEELATDFPNSVQAQNFACLVFKRRQEFAAAISYCERAIAAGPQDVGPVINLSLIFMQQEDYPRALSGFNAVLAVSPRDTRALGGLAYIAEQQGELDMAIRVSERLAAYQPRDTRYRLKLAEYFLQQGNAPKALEAIDYAEKIEPLNPRSFVLRTRAYKMQGDFEAAAAQLRFLYGMYSADDPDALLSVAEEQLSIEYLEDARVTIDRLLESPGYEDRARLLLAEHNYLAGQPSDCVKALEPRLRSGLADRQKLLLVQCYTADAQPGKALAVLDSMLREAPNDGLAVQRFRLRLVSDRGGAITQLERFVEQHPDSPQSIKAIGDYYVYVDLAKAKAAYLKLRANWPDYAGAEVNNNLANIFLQLDGDREQAVEHAQRAYALSPDNPSIADTYGWVLVRNAQYNEGLKYLREAWARRSGSDQVNYHLAYALAKLGRGDEARRYAKNVSDRAGLSAEQQARLADIENDRPF